MGVKGIDGVDQLDQDTFLEVIRNAVRDQHAEVGLWSAQPIVGGASDSQLQLFTGTARTADGDVDWSFVLKTVRHDGEVWQESSTDPSVWNFWKREWLLYQAPWATDLSGLHTPRCFGVGEIGDSSVWVAMEDLRPYDRRPWSNEQFTTCARHLGEFNGHFLINSCAPPGPWLSRDWIHGWVARADALFDQLPAFAAHPDVAKMIPPHRLRLLSRVWEHRHDLRTELGKLRHSIAHNDVYPRNAFVDLGHGNDRTVAIDWAFCGWAPLGADLVPLIASSLCFFEIDCAQADQLEPMCQDAYLAGLRRVGVDADPDELKVAYLITFGLRTMIGTSGPLLALALDHSLDERFEQTLGHSRQELLANWREIVAFGEPRMASLLARFGYA